jgi:type I restriction enzyme S subunit
MDVLLSIKPEFAEKILGHEKRYEFRKTPFRDPSIIETVYMYASSPVQEIVGSFSLNSVSEGTPAELWREFGSDSGIDQRSRFMDYFAGTDTGYAFEVADVHRFTEPVDPQQRVDDFRPPVSFQYLRGEYDSLIATEPTSGSD